MKNIATDFFVKYGKNGKCAVVIRKDDVDIQVSEEKYDKVWRARDWSIFAISNGYWTILDKKTGLELVRNDIYTFISEDNYGRRLCRSGDLYAVMINYKVVSPWYDFIKFERNFNIARIDDSEFMTSGNGCYIFSDGYKSFGRFDIIPELNKSFAEVLGLNGKYGVVDSNGKLVIPCKYKKLHTLNRIFKIYEYELSNGSIMYGILGINGEPVTREGYIRYEISKGRIKMVTPDEEVHIFNTFCQRVKK